MSKFEFGQEYYLTTYSEISEYLKNMISDDENKQIKYIFTNGPLMWRDIDNAKRYSLDSDIYIVFDNDSVLRIDYKFYSLVYISHMWIQNLNIREKEFNNDEFKLDLDCKNARIDGMKIERFSKEYEINPASGTIRPDGGDYFKNIIFELSNGKQLCICAEASENDGYCDIWVK